MKKLEGLPLHKNTSSRIYNNSKLKSEISKIEEINSKAELKVTKPI